MTGFDGMLSFSACDLWPSIRGKTLWIMGDSHSYDLFHSVACFLLPVRTTQELLALDAFFLPCPTLVRVYHL